MSSDSFSRDDEIRVIWKEHQWLYLVVGFVVGVLFCLLIQLSIQNLPAFIIDFIPELAGILLMLLIVDRWIKRQEKRAVEHEQFEQYVRDARSSANNVTANAILQLRDRNKLIGSNALLIGKNLSGANLQNAKLYEANLYKTNLMMANLQGALLTSSNLCDSNLVMANVSEANLNFAELQAANLSSAELNNTEMMGANLQNAILVGANLEAANLRATNLREAMLIRANLCRSNLEAANLTNANLSEVNLANTFLASARLQGADLSGASLRNADLGQATYEAQFDATTTLPDGTHWTPETDMSRFTHPQEVPAL
jgi:uncharacterized protein YjbI with pentapeptide repeats